ncbi:MAG: hypothetical protein U0M21_03840 [Emergencia sp.]|nr:hypothetical protein [Emergencia sp.]
MKEKTLKSMTRLLTASGLSLLCLPAIANLDLAAYKFFIPCGLLILALDAILPPLVSAKIFSH